MSLFREIKVHCPSCHEAVILDAVHSVNADRRPDLRDEILAGDFQRCQCNACQQPFRLDPSLTYLDVGPVPQHQHPIKLDRITGGSVNLLQLQDLTFFHSMLLTTTFEHSVHYSLQSLSPASKQAYTFAGASAATLTVHV